MKRRYFSIGVVALTALLTVVFVALLSHTSVARTAPPGPPPTTTDPSPSPPADYLIVLPVTLPAPEEVPAGMSPEQAVYYAHGLTYRQAEPIIVHLQRLQAEGKVAGFEVRPDLNGVAVKGAAPDVPEELSRLQGVAAVLPLGETPPACAVAAAGALSEQAIGLSQMAANADRSLRAASTAIQATDPSIDVYAPPGESRTYVEGRTTPNTAVTMRILRGGRVVATRSTTSDGGGYYSFFPSWSSCPTWGYDWTLQPGDVVEVTAHGNTVRTVVAYLSAWVDPVANTVAGRTEAGRSVEVRLTSYGSDPCSSTDSSRTVGTDGSGNFSANFADFDGRAYAYVYARDGNGNSTYASFFAYRIVADFTPLNPGGYFWGYLKPGVSFTATLSRGGSIVSTYSGRSSPGGYYSGSFTSTIRPGDVVEVSGGDVSIRYTATDLRVTLDPANDRATGTTGAGRRVQAHFYKAARPFFDTIQVQTTCSANSKCRGTTANASGAFTLSTSLDLVRGDYAYFYVYDDEGNYQKAWYSTPVIAASLNGNMVSGYWSNPNAGYVTITIRSSDGTVKGSNSTSVSSSYSGGFVTWILSTQIVPGDTVAVTDGTVTETIAVPTGLAIRLDGDTGGLILTGTVSGSYVIAKLWDFRRESMSWYEYCAETKVTNTPFNLTFSGAQVGGQDYALVWIRSPEEHYLFSGFRPFTLNVQKNGSTVYGYTETPSTPVTITLRHEGSSVIVTTTPSDGSYYTVTLPATIAQGDVVQVQTGDGDNVSLSIPELTVNTDGANNRVYGKSPANEPVRVGVSRYYNWGAYNFYLVTTADGSGNYSASFNGLSWSDCSAVNVGHRCIQPSVQYYNSAGHQVWLTGPLPPPVGPDLYESDDISTTARPYTGIQSHTFHTVTDTDWITFTVPQEDVDNGVPYRIETFNLGWGMGTIVRLYDTDGTSLLGEWWGFEYRGRGVSALWTPPAAGTYYLEVRPPSASYAAYCDAVYDLLILPERARVYLPLVLKGY